MLVSLLCQILSAWFAFLLPSYSTWKALSHRDVSERDLQRWCMYWSVVGAFVAFENVAEWFVSWLPFYWETKMLFLLFLSLPQTQGSTWIYATYFQPFFSKNEAEIDAGIVAAQANVLTFVQTRLNMLWEMLSNLATKSGAHGSATNGQQAQHAAANPLDLAKGLWDTYGPGQHSMGSSTPNFEHRTSGMSSAPSSSASSSHSSVAPPFPESQLY